MSEGGSVLHVEIYCARDVTWDAVERYLSNLCASCKDTRYSMVTQRLLLDASVFTVGFESPG